MTQPPFKQFSGIFISYRRDDAAGHAGRLYDRLSAHFGGAQVFMDIDHIQPGEDFVRVIEDAVGSCVVLLAIIGRDWLASTDAGGRRLDNPNDFIRLEITAALKRNVRVIPLLVQGAEMPKPQDLPEDLSVLSRRHALELSDVRWRQDVTQLIGTLERILDECYREARAEKELQRREPDARPQEEPVRTPPIAPLVDAGETESAARRRARMIRTLLAAAGALVLVVVTFALFQGQGGATNENTGVTNENTASNTNKSGGGVGAANTPTAPDGMVYVPGGEFTMGRDGDDEYERPAHRVTVQPFFIDKREVTCAEYAEFVSATGHRAPPGWTGRSCPRGSLLKPVTSVEWDDATAYARWAGKRLPTEAEWEYAARGPEGRLYPWGNDWQSGMANVARAGLSDVMEWKGVSPFGLFDMTGNAWEWTADKLEAYLGGRLPHQPEGDERVIRGGSYAERPAMATATYRGFLKASGDPNGYARTGFRCAKSLEPSAR